MAKPQRYFLGLKKLSQRENFESTETAFVSNLKPSQHAKIVDLAGRKCIVKCLLNDTEVLAM